MVQSSCVSIKYSVSQSQMGKLDKVSRFSSEKKKVLSFSSVLKKLYFVDPLATDCNIYGTNWIPLTTTVLLAPISPLEKGRTKICQYMSTKIQKMLVFWFTDCLSPCINALRDKLQHKFHVVMMSSSYWRTCRLKLKGKLTFAW